MLSAEDRLFAPSGAIYPGGPSYWRIVDWDQRRLISVKMDQELNSDEPAIEHLLKYIDDLDPNVYEIHVSSQGELISVSTDPKDDQTLAVYYPSLEKLQRPPHIQVVSRSNLKEIDRITANVDLVVCPNEPESSKKFIFKYYFLYQHLNSVWHEMSLWMRLPKHPNIVPFDRVVVDDLGGRVLAVGFTSVYIPGGTLADNKSRPFKLKWLHQLISVVDELSLNLGIAPQDVAPRNLLIAEETDTIMLFDFNFSARIGRAGFFEARNDIKGVMFTMHEIITRDDQFRAVRHEEQDVSAIENVEWVKHPDVVLDHPIEDFCTVLREWRERRRAGKQITFHTEAPNYLDWPPVPDTSIAAMETGLDGSAGKLYDWNRQEMLAAGKEVLDWQRPPQRRLRCI